MVTLHQVLNFNIARLSAEIRDLKAQAFKTEKAWRSIFDVEWGCFQRREYDRATEFMSPGHPLWPAFQAKKQDVSRFLSAIHLLKFGSGQPPAKKDVRKAIRAGRLNFHVHPSQASAFVFGAYALLLRTDEELRAHPERFAEAAQFAAQRERERQEGARDATP